MSRQTFEITLPSRGLLYEGKLPEGKLSIHPIRVKEEKYLAGITGPDQVNKALSIVLQECIATPGIKADELLLVDRVYLLFQLRSISYGSDYSIEYRCHECGSIHRAVADLAALDVKELEDTIQEPLEITLPSGAKLGIKCLRQTDVDAIARVAKSALAKAKPGEHLGDVTHAYSMARQIVTVNGEEMGDRDKLEWVENLIGRDSASLTEQMSDAFNFGLDTTVKVECPVGHENFIALPFTAEFFRPRASHRT